MSTIFREYCDLDSVKRILRSQTPITSKVKFSSSYKALKANENNVGSIQLSGVTFSSSYSGHEDFTFTFTDSTSFEVSSDIFGYLTNGSTISLLNISGTFSVPIGNWSGSAESGDEINISSDSDISDDDAEEFITDARRYINAQLENAFGSLDDLPFISDQSKDIPEGIIYACQRYASYEIWNSIFSGANSDEESPVERWKTMADNAVSIYLKGKGVAPRWNSRNGLITKIGVPGVGDGEINIDPIDNNSNKEFKR
jgi:hypothetical protein